MAYTVDPDHPGYMPPPPSATPPAGGSTPPAGGSTVPTSGATFTGGELPVQPDHWLEQKALADRDYALSEAIFKYNQDQDQLRKDNVQESMAEIKRLFGDRAGLYGQLGKESMALNKRRLGELQEDASRNLNFSLARAGNVGGSTEVDKNRELAEKMGLGLGQAEIFAQSQADQMRAQDEALRSSLNSLAASGAVSGGQVGSQAKSALSGLRGTAGYMGGIDNTFGGLSGQIGAAGGANVQTPQTQSTRFGF